MCVGSTMYLLCRHVLSWFWAGLPYRSLVVDPWNSAIVESFIGILCPLSVAVAAQKLLHGSEIIPIRQPLRGAFYSAEEEIEMEGVLRKAAINWNDWEIGGGGDQLFSYQTNNQIWKMETRRKWKAEKVTSSSSSSPSSNVSFSASEIKELVHPLGT